MSKPVTFTTVAGAEVRYARAPVATYGTIGKGPRKQRLRQEALYALEAAIRELGEIHPWGPPRYIVSAGAMVPQSERRGPTDAHVRGLAYDIDAIWWPDGPRIQLPSGPPATRRLVTLDAPERWRHYISIQCILARWFGVVLGYDYNAAHHDHWHVDVTRPARFDWGPRMDVVLLQRALVAVWGCDLVVDGKCGPKTMAAWAAAAEAEGYLPDWREWLLATARRGLEDV